MQRNVERLIEAVVLLEVRPLGRPGNEDEVSGGRDRQELCQALDDAEDQSLSVRERSGIVPHSRDRQDGCEAERGPRDAEHDGAAHAEILRTDVRGARPKKTGANCGNPVNEPLDPAGRVP